MGWFKVTGYARVEFKTLVKAEDEEEAMQEVADRDISICIHGTEDSEALDDWVYTDLVDMVVPNLAEEADENHDEDEE